MVESLNKKYPYNYLTKQQLSTAMEIPKDYKPDKVTSYLMENTEKHFEQKKVYTSRDWLVTQNEVGQTPKKYSLGGPNIRMMNSKQKKIVLFAIDDTINDQTMELYRGYCEAFFYGADV